MKHKLQINAHTLSIENWDKVFFPQAGSTKGDLIEYYRKVSDVILPYLQGRPLTLQRFPDGIQAQGFYQKEAQDYFPEWIPRIEIELKGEKRAQTQLICENLEALVYLVDLGTITPHVWLSRRAKLNQPDKMVFDLDPPDDDFDLVRQAARDLHACIKAIGARPFVMTTGSRGLHVVLPLEPSADFDEVRAFAQDLATRLVANHPESYTQAIRKEKRKGRLFLDTARNAYGQTCVAPYAVRALPNAPVATPLDWQELEQPDLHPQRYRMDNLLRRLGQKEDPWRDFKEAAIPLEAAKNPEKAL